MNAIAIKPVPEPETKPSLQQAKEQIMKKMSVMIALVGWSGLALGSPVGVYVNDSFTAPTLDSTVWDSSTGGVSIVSNQVKIQGGWIQSKAMVSPDLGETVIVSATEIWNTDYSNNTYWGLSDATGNNYIILDEQGNWNVKMSKGEVSQVTADKVEWGDLMRGAWTISWSPTQVLIMQGATVKFDSSVTGPSGGGSWNFPTVDMGIKAGALDSSKELYFGSLSLEVVPEPASLALLGAAGLLVVNRRRRG
ncbi:MAG: PEP-CTERM sorting domain-containing protein [Lentisphaeria bacterium]